MQLLKPYPTYAAANTANAYGGSLNYLRPPVGDSIYHAGFIQITKRYAQNFQFLASYTWSKVIDTLPDQTSVVPNNGGDDAVGKLHARLEEQAAIP